jgi:hypothetical protein
MATYHEKSSIANSKRAQSEPSRGADLKSGTSAPHSKGAKPSTGPRPSNEKALGIYRDTRK